MHSRLNILLCLSFLSFFCMGMGSTPKDTTPPQQVSITSPINNSTVSGTVIIQATAIDNKGMSRVVFYVDSTLKSTDTTSPYAYSWDTSTATNDAHILKVIAYDTSGNSTPAQINVTVNNYTPPPEPELSVTSISASGSNSSHPAPAAIDKNNSTYWQGN